MNEDLYWHDRGRAEFINVDCPHCEWPDSESSGRFTITFQGDENSLRGEILQVFFRCGNGGCKWKGKSAVYFPLEFSHDSMGYDLRTVKAKVQKCDPELLHATWAGH